MGKEVDGISDYGGPAADKNEERVLEWENGLPTADDLIPLSQSLIPQELASAFSISPEPTKTLLDVHRASQSTVSSLRRQVAYSLSSAAAGRDRTDRDDLDPVVDDGDEGEGKEGGVSETKSLKKARARGSDETEDAGFGSHVENEENSNSGRVSKKPRLVWTPQLQKRFVDVVAHLGLKNAVPKTIMQLMNVEGLTRENVASHLQKYRLYIKRMRGISDEGASSSSPPPPLPPAADNSHQQRVTTTGTHVPSLTPYASPHGTLPIPVTGMDHHPYAMFGDNFGAVPPRSSCQ